MQVYIIGAGPGDPDLITVKGAALIARCPVVLYTGSLVPKEVIATARKDALVLDSAGMNLDEIIAVMKQARDEDKDVARVHTGDPSVFSSIAEQVRRLDQEGIPSTVIPGVSSFAAAAAAAHQELTLPELCQTVILTRAEGRTPVPPLEQLPELARHRSTLCLFLSITLLTKVTRQLIPEYGADCPVVVVHKASLPEQKIIRGTLEDIGGKVRAEKIRSQSMVIVGRVLGHKDFADSRLYASDFSHGFRKAVTGGTEASP